MTEHNTRVDEMLGDKSFHIEFHGYSVQILCPSSIPVLRLVRRLVDGRHVARGRQPRPSDGQRAPRV